MKTEILELEKSLFKYKFMSNINYLNKIIDDNYIEIGKSGKKFTKQDIIRELINLKEDRNIVICNFKCTKISEDIYLIHYITKKDIDNIFRTSIWKKENDEFKILFHQASLYLDEIELKEC